MTPFRSQTFSSTCDARIYISTARYDIGLKITLVGLGKLASMRRFLLFVGLCLTCFAATLGQEDDNDVLSNELRKMVRNGDSLEDIFARAQAGREKGPVKKEKCTISVKGNATRIGRGVTYGHVRLGSESAHSEEDPIISARVECGGAELYNEQKKRSELKRVNVKDVSTRLSRFLCVNPTL